MSELTVDAGPPVSGLAKHLTPFNILTGIILAGGAVILGVRFTQGLSATTNLSHNYPWGLWIGFDVMSGVALAAGGFVTSTAVYVFGMKEYKPVVRAAILTGFLGYFLVVLGLLADLGRPWRLPYAFIKSAGPTSPLFEVSLCVALYLTVLFIESTPAALEWLGLKRWRKVVGSLTLGLTIFGLILSTMHQSTLGAMFMATPTKLHPLWFSPHIPVHYFVSAVAAGLAMVIVEGWFSHRAFHHQVEISKQHFENINFGLAKAASVTLGIYFAIKVVALTLEDEWYLLAGLPLPPRERYEDLPQQENGVGSIRAFLESLDEATRSLPRALDRPRRLSWVVGRLVAEALEPVVHRLNRVRGLELILHGLPSPYWGQEQVVTGLLTGSDLLAGLGQQDLGERLLLPAVMLRQGEPVFLDDLRLEELEAQLPVPVQLIQGAADLVAACTGGSRQDP